MFQTSADKSLAPDLQAIAEEIEERTPGLYVVAAQQYQYPVTQSAMDIWVSEPRKFNVLEEFTLRAALELNPPPMVSDLSEAFGLDSIFLEKTYRDLVNIGAVTFDEGGSILLTPDGRTFYADGQVPQPPKHERVYFLCSSLTTAITARTSASTALACDLAKITDVLDIPLQSNFVASMTLDEKREVLTNTLPGIHDPKQGKIATSIESASPAELLWQPISLFLLYDDLEQRWALHARKGKTRLSGAQPLLDQVIEKGPEHFLELFEVSQPDEVEDNEVAADEANSSEQERFARLQELVRESLRRERKAIESTAEVTPDVQAGSITMLRNEKIRPEFIKLLSSAKREVIIFSPWINEQVVDNDFISMLRALASRNVWIMIGYGIARTLDKEDRKIPPAVIDKIHAIRSPQGAPVARVVWLGGSHAKEVVVDSEVYLFGSFNWLSYRGGRGETVSRIAIPDHVAEARNGYSERFIKRAEEMWGQSCDNTFSEEGLSALSIMGALGGELDALKMIASAKRFDLLPAWTRIIANNLVHGDVEVGALCLSEASDLFAQIEPDALLGPDFGQVWKAAIKQIKAKNVALAHDLLHHPSWEYYATLGLADPDVTPETYLAEPKQAKVSFEYKKSKKKKK